MDTTTIEDALIGIAGSSMGGAAAFASHRSSPPSAFGVAA